MRHSISFLCVHIIFYIFFKYFIRSECSAQWQVFHCKLRHRVAVLLGMNRCGTFPLLSAPHSLFGIWTDLKRSENIPGAPAWRWWEWIWLTRPSGLHLTLPQGLNVSSIRVFDQIRDPEITITLRLYTGWFMKNVIPSGNWFVMSCWWKKFIWRWVRFSIVSEKTTYIFRICMKPCEPRSVDLHSAWDKQAISW